MANIMTKRGNQDNVITYEHICDTTADMANIESQYKTLGSVCIVIKGESGGLEVYMMGSDKQWVSITEVVSGSGDSSTGLSIHVCTEDEVDSQTGLPDIDDPDDKTIYLVPAGNTSGNLYEEYIYVDDAWEKFGGGSSGSIDVSNKANIANPEFTGSISLGRKANTTIGIESIAIGNDVTASGNNSCAIGDQVSATGRSSHAEGTCTETGYHSYAGYLIPYGATSSNAHVEGEATAANGLASHAEGGYTMTFGNQAHAEGYNTFASSDNSHAEGAYTIAKDYAEHVGGKYNVTNILLDTAPKWTANTAYSYGDRVRHKGTYGTYTYICIIPNNDSVFDNTKWIHADNLYKYAEIIGNGLNEDNRSNARALDWDGNEYLKGDIYVNCNADGTGGTKLARIPAAPSTDGTYMLQCVVSSGVPTYTWISAPSASE